MNGHIFSPFSYYFRKGNRLFFNVAVNANSNKTAIRKIGKFELKVDVNQDKQDNLANT